MRLFHALDRCAGGVVDVDLAAATTETLVSIALVGIEGLRRKPRDGTCRIPFNERQNVAGAPMLRRTRERWEQSRV